MASMLRKKEVFTIITPIPGFIPRQLAIDILHSHSEVITVNPLVLDHKPIKAPQHAAPDEYFSTWYEITERIQYLPGLGRMGAGKISFNGCFHDLPWGLQTHIYAPLHIDLKNKYRIAGNQPGVEAPEPLEMGLSALGAPSDGLYLRDDVEIKAHISLVGFVKAQLKAASKEMVSRIIKKAELLDAGVLHAMIEHGKLRTINPNDRSVNNSNNNNTAAAPLSPRPQTSATTAADYRLDDNNCEPARPYHVPRSRPVSYQAYHKPSHLSLVPDPRSPHWSAPYGSGGGATSPQPHLHHLPSHAELPAAGHHGGGRGGAPPPPPPAVIAEMPGDHSFSQPVSASPRPPPPPPSVAHPSFSEHASSSAYSRPSSRVSLPPPPPPPPSYRSSTSSFASSSYHGGNSNDWRWSQQSQAATTAHSSSRPTSVSSNPSTTGGGWPLAALDQPPQQQPQQQGFTSELATHNEDPEESVNISHTADALRRLELGRDDHDDGADNDRRSPVPAITTTAPTPTAAAAAAAAAAAYAQQANKYAYKPADYLVARRQERERQRSYSYGAEYTQ